MNMLTAKEQWMFYIQWCKDNNREPKDAKSLKAYLEDIAFDADKRNLCLGKAGA